MQHFAAFEVPEESDRFSRNSYSSGLNELKKVKLRFTFWF
jgi:hypothetical protein